jgi:hypothetical protein
MAFMDHGLTVFEIHSGSALAVSDIEAYQHTPFGLIFDLL